jgi:hypothetical protein
VGKLKSASYVFNAIRRSSARQGVGHARSLRRFVHLYRKRRFSPYEIYFNDLLNPVVSDEALENYICKEEMIALDEKHALSTYLCLTADKAVFYALCSAAGLRVPRLLAVFDLPVGWGPEGRTLRSPAEWGVFAQELPPDFIVKPALGLLGKGLTAFHHEGNDFVDHEGRRRNRQEFYEFLCHAKEQNLFSGTYSHHSLKLPQKSSHKAILQERVYAHGAIAELTGSDAISTCRLFTHTGGQGETQIVASAFRLIGSKNIADNFDKGTKGNLWCGVDTDTGRILDAFSLMKGTDRLERISRHPDTGREVVGFLTPCWDEVRELALHLAEVFRPQSLIHWDIGVTPSGPVVIEGNVGGSILPTALNRPARALLDGR